LTKIQENCVKKNTGSNTVSKLEEQIGANNFGDICQKKYKNSRKNKDL